MMSAIMEIITVAALSFNMLSIVHCLARSISLRDKQEKGFFLFLAVTNIMCVVINFNSFHILQN